MLQLLEILLSYLYLLRYQYTLLSLSTGCLDDGRNRWKMAVIVSTVDSIKYSFIYILEIRTIELAD